MWNRPSTPLQKSGEDTTNVLRIALTPREILAACVGGALAVTILAVGAGQWFDAGLGALATVINIFFFLTLPARQ